MVHGSDRPGVGFGSGSGVLAVVAGTRSGAVGARTRIVRAGSRVLAVIVRCLGRLGCLRGFGRFRGLGGLGGVAGAAIASLVLALVVVVTLLVVRGVVSGRAAVNLGCTRRRGLVRRLGG